MKLTKENMAKVTRGIIIAEDMHLYDMMVELVWAMANGAAKRGEEQHKGLNHMINHTREVINLISTRLLHAYYNLAKGNCNKCDSPRCPISPEYGSEIKSDSGSIIVISSSVEAAQYIQDMLRKLTDKEEQPDSRIGIA